MLYLKAREFGIQDIYLQAYQQITVLGKRFVIDEWLSRKQENLAQRKCRSYLDSDTLCLLVEFSDRYGLYLSVDNSLNTKSSQGLEKNKSHNLDLMVQEKIGTPQNSISKTAIDRVGLVETFSDLSQLVDRLAQSMDRESEQEFRQLVSQRLITESNAALEILQQALKQIVGPIAAMIYEDLVSECDSVNTFKDISNLIDRLAAEIDESEYEQQFRQLVSQQLIVDSNSALEILRQALHKSVGPIAETIYQDVINE